MKRTIAARFHKKKLTDLVSEFLFFTAVFVPRRPYHTILKKLTDLVSEIFFLMLKLIYYLAVSAKILCPETDTEEEVRALQLYMY